VNLDAFAMAFPGQGSQSVGMQSALAEEHAIVAQTYAEASESLGFDLWSLVQKGPGEQLDVTEVTQPAMLTAGVAAWRVWQSACGPAPRVMAGHSLGEYTALVCAGSLDFKSGVSLVRKRGELMRDAAADIDGAMAAILGLDDDAIVEVCAKVANGEVAEAVNFNSPGQVVVAGHRAAIERVIEAAKAAGARRALILPVSVPAHSSIMRPAGVALAGELEATEFHAPEIEVMSSVAVRPYRDTEDIRSLLTEQISAPVQWVKTVEAMLEAGADGVIECGPGKVLTGLMRRINRDVAAACLETPDSVAELTA